MSNQWKRIAVEQANRCYEELFEAHRGAYLLYRPNVYVVFGNDGFSAEAEDEEGNKAQREYYMVRASIEADPRAEFLAPGLNDEGHYTWVAIVRSLSPEIGLEELNGLVWNAFKKVSNEGDGPEDTMFSRLQSKIAEKVLDEMCKGDLPPSLN